MKARRLHVALALAAAMVATACGSAGDTAGSETTPEDPAPTTADGGGESPAGDEGDPATSFEGTTMRVGFSSSRDFTDLYFVRWERQLQENHGITLEPFSFEGVDDAARALAAGQVDVVMSAPAIAARLVQQGSEPVKIIALDTRTTDYIVATTPDVESIEDMEGKKWGITTTGDFLHALAIRTLEQNSVDPESVEFVEVGGTSARVAALTAGQINAGAAHAAEGFLAMEEAGLNRVANFADVAPKFANNSMFASDTWLSENQELAQVAVNEFIDAVRWAATDAEGYMELSNEIIEEIPEDVRTQAYELFLDIEMFAINGGLEDTSIIEAALEIEKEVGNISGDLPAIEEFVDTSYVANYLEVNGVAE